MNIFFHYLFYFYQLILLISFSSQVNAVVNWKKKSVFEKRPLYLSYLEFLLITINSFVLQDFQYPLLY